MNTLKADDSIQRTHSDVHYMYFKQQMFTREKTSNSSSTININLILALDTNQK